MTLAPETSPILTDTEPALSGEARLEEIYRKYWRPLHMFIYVRVDDRHKSLAEDMAADAFLALWTKYLSAGAPVWGPWSLLRAIARTVIMDFYKVRANKRLDFAVDFTDPANRGIERGHSYAPDQPEVAQLAGELEEALEVMAELSQKWRDQHSRSHVYRTMLVEDSMRAPLAAAVKAETQEKLKAATVKEDRMLEEFRRSCARVGGLRIELEEAGGPNWCSSTGQPPTQNRGFVKPGTMGDPERTHCDAGHELTLENTTFTRGYKICRTCRAIETKKARGPRTAAAKPVALPTPDATIERARELLKDPTLTLREVAAMVGIGLTTLKDRIPDRASLRGPAKSTRTPDEVIARARSLLLDPAKKRTVREVERAVGVTAVTLYSRIPNLAQLRRELYDAPQLVSA